MKIVGTFCGIPVRQAREDDLTDPPFSIVLPEYAVEVLAKVAHVNPLPHKPTPFGEWLYSVVHGGVCNDEKQERELKMAWDAAIAWKEKREAEERGGCVACYGFASSKYHTFCPHCGRRYPEKKSNAL